MKSVTYHCERKGLFPRLRDYLEGNIAPGFLYMYPVRCLPACALQIREGHKIR
jgi:hypothetical protein